MKKIYTVMLSLLVAIAALVGLWSLVDKDATESQSENRRLASKPKFSIAALLDGSYTAELENYYSDTFPGREALLKANSVLNKFYIFSGKDNHMLVIDFTNDVGEGGQALDPLPPPAEEENAEQEQVSEIVEEEQTQPEPEVEEPDYDSMEVTNAGSIIILGNRAMDIPTATDSIIVSYAEAVNNIHDAIGHDVRVLPLIAPNSGQFYSPTDMHTGVHDQKAMIELCYENMDDEVLTVDAYSALEKNRKQELYFRTDHHWTALGAYYAYNV